MFAAGKGLGNLTAVIDFNRWQATGRSCETLALEPLARKWQAFGWRAGEVDGHDLHALVRALGATRPGQPSAIVAHTTKGKGISFMEDDNDWHYATLNDRQLAQALEELDA